MTSYYDDKVICTECGCYNYPDEDDYDSCTEDALRCDDCEALIEFEIYVEHKKEVEYKVYRVTPVQDDEPDEDDDMWGA